jgi:hypothetical protein
MGWSVAGQCRFLRIRSSAWASSACRTPVFRGIHIFHLIDADDRIGNENRKVVYPCHAAGAIQGILHFWIRFLAV